MYRFSCTWGIEKKDNVKFLTFILIKFVPFGISLFIPASGSAALPSYIAGLDLVHGTPVEVKVSQARLGTVVVFLSIRCPCSASHQAVLNQLAYEFEPKGFQFVGVHSNVNEAAKPSLEFFSSSKLSFPVIHDAQAQIADDYQAFKTPHVFIVSPKLEILFRGGVDNSKVVERATRFYLRDALQAILVGKEPSEKEVRVLGCEIKRP